MESLDDYLSRRFQGEGQAPSIASLKAIGHQKRSILMLPLPNRKFSFDGPSGASMYYSLFKHKGCLKGGMPVNRNEGNEVLRSLPLDACVKDVSETNINIESFVKFPMVDVYGCVSCE